MSSTPPPLPKSAAELLGGLFPPLELYWPNLSRVSAPQTAFLLLDCLEAGYGGAAGGGKSDALLAAALQYVNRPRYAALILRRTFADLALPGAIMARSHEWLTGKAHWNHDRKTWTFPSGATLTFGYLDNERDVYRYQGSEYQFVAFDELTQFLQAQYRYLFSRLRRTGDIDVPLRMRWASNPGNIGHGWVKKDYIDAATRKPAAIFIPAKVADNPGLVVDEYVQSLSHLDDTLRAQLLDGDWGAFEGMAFPDFDEQVHVVPAMSIPEDWQRAESMDFGVSNPSCVLAWATDYDGNAIIYDSYYSPRNTLVSAQAAAILAKREVWWPLDRDGYPVASPTCYADPSMWAKTSGETQLGDPASDVTEFLEHGVEGLVRANNDRRAGRIRLLELMRPDPERAFPRWHPRYGEPGSPRLFVVKARCPELVEQLSIAPLLPLDSGKTGAGEIVDPDWESPHGHAVATARYGALSWLGPSEEPVQEAEDPRVRMLARIYRAEREQEEEELYQ